MHVEQINELDKLLEEAGKKTDSEPKIAEEIALNVLASATKIGSKGKIKESHICLLRSFIFQGRYEDAKNKGYYIIENFDLSTYETGKVYRLISAVYYFILTYDKAIEYSLKALEFAQECDDKETIGNAYNVLALSYEKIHEYFETRKYLELSLKTKEENPDITNSNRAITIENIGNFYLTLKEYDRALIYYNEAKEIYLKEKNNYRQASILNSIGFTYLVFQNLDAAEEYSKKAYLISKKFQFDHLQSFAAINLGNLEYERKNYKAALNFGLEAKKLSDDILSIDESYIRMFLLLSNAYMQLGKMDKSLEMALAGLEINDSLKTWTTVDLYQNIVTYYNSKEDYKNAFFYQQKKEKDANTCNLSRILYEKKKATYKLELEGRNREIGMQQQQLSKEQKLKKKLQESNTYLNEFIDVLTHDIKAPIRHIQGFSNLLKRKIDEKSYPQYVEFIDTINASSSLLTEMIDSLYSYAKIGADSYKMRLLSPKMIIESIKTIFHNSIKEKNAQIIVNVPHNIFSEKTLLFQLFQNIIQNSLKYSKDDVSPIIQISSKENKDFIIISISDNGIGIGKSDLKRIFHPFSRSQMVKNQKEGLGIGLATCYKIMNLHEGRIDVESTLGQGTTFKLYFPNTVS